MHLQRSILAAAVLVLLVWQSSCKSTGKPDSDRSRDYHGTSSDRTPYDGKYEKVRRYLHEAFTRIRYTPETGTDAYEPPPDGGDADRNGDRDVDEDEQQHAHEHARGDFVED